MAHRFQREAYTVGWVCALPIELAAAQEMLDEEHEDLEQDENDSNLYSFGSIGGHKVVLACLPAGQTGTNSAAAVAMQMKATFKGIRFGLMVGIGGGVPSGEVDIRLGDVVVSQPVQALAAWSSTTLERQPQVALNGRDLSMLRRRYCSVQLPKCRQTTFGYETISLNTSLSLAVSQSLRAPVLGLIYYSKQHTTMLEDGHAKRVVQIRWWYGSRERGEMLLFTTGRLHRETKS
jgi:hypothetical protein